MQILSVTQQEDSLVLDGVRGILWFITKGVLMLLDGFFNVINEVWQFRFFDNEYVNKLLSASMLIAITFLGVKVVLELILHHIVNKKEHSLLYVFKGIVVAVFVMFLITPLFSYAHNISTELTKSVITISGFSTEESTDSTISRMIIKSTANTDQMTEENLEYFLDNWKTVKINSDEGGVLGFGETYIYSFNLFIMLIISILVVFLLFFIGIQMAKRVVELALYKIIGPIVATGLTNPGSKVFETWFKGVLGLFVITSVQFIGLGLLINVFGSAGNDVNNIFSILILLIGALLFVITSPTIISSLIGQQSGAITAFGDIQAMMALSGGIQMGMGVAKTASMGALGKATNVYNKSPLKGKIDLEGSPFASSAKSVFNKITPNKNREPNSTNINNPYSSPYSKKFNSLRNIYKGDSNDNRWY